MTRKLSPRASYDGVENIPLMENWIASRPDDVRKLASEYPLGSVITDYEGDDWYIIGWTEGDELIVSPIWIGDNYGDSMEARHWTHVAHLRERPDLVKYVRRAPGK